MASTVRWAVRIRDSMKPKGDALENNSKFNWIDMLGKPLYGQLLSSLLLSIVSEP